MQCIVTKANVYSSGTIPSSWRKYAVPKSMSLGMWVADLAQRLRQLEGITKEQHYEKFSVTLGLLFTPGAYLTATRQAVAHRTRVSLEKLKLDLRVNDGGEADNGFSLEGESRPANAIVQQLTPSRHRRSQTRRRCLVYLAPRAQRWLDDGSRAKQPCVARRCVVSQPRYLDRPRNSLPQRRPRCVAVQHLTPSCQRVGGQHCRPASGSAPSSIVRLPLPLSFSIIYHTNSMLRTHTSCDRRTSTIAMVTAKLHVENVVRLCFAPGGDTSEDERGVDDTRDGRREVVRGAYLRLEAGPARRGF